MYLIYHGFIKTKERKTNDEKDTFGNWSDFFAFIYYVFGDNNISAFGRKTISVY